MLNMNKLSLLIKKEEINAEINKYANKLNEKYENKELSIIAILNGSLFLFSDLLKKLKFPIKIDTITVSSYSGVKSSNELLYHKKIVKPIIKNQDVLIVEDIIDTGKTMNSVYEYVNSLNPKSLNVLVLASKKDTPTKFKYKYDSLFTIPDKYIVGYGFGIDDLYRQLENIYTIESNEE
ncbi:hypoxanthine-guanine phosphoribosyltransferase [Spiroplasma litorale]|uniref:Hypoxanthine-guanine phosphoribosyltransferase n=1 Tax=Spiroplasma litorale TaxID=216942 RepID=A0A0K1W1C1_9MOLU|nr:phosphoribosyltransferase family protein [Spiroplasma litorale]AKX33968.1 hypoxanthine-guanine phosphoribosyltransferase [Spiroplasma litorale]